jgi:putative ABC transport system ATP-binding protein
MSPLIEMTSLWKVHASDAGPVTALREIEIQIGAGEFIAVVGPSGSGKSTFMHLVGCLDRPTSGTYRLNGRDVGTLPDRELAHVRNLQIGFVFQNFNLMPRLTNLANVALPLLYGGWRRTLREKRARDLLSRVGLEHKAAYLPGQISGGEQQRVAIARALALEPSLVLADEPTGNLDTATSSSILDLFSDTNAQLGTTLVFVTHDPSAARRARRMLRLIDGRIDYDGPASDRSQ